MSNTCPESVLDIFNIQGQVRARVNQVSNERSQFDIPSVVNPKPYQKVKVARLQSECCTKDFFEPRIFLRKMLRNSPKFLSLCSVGQKKSPENSLQISH